MLSQKFNLPIFIFLSLILVGGTASLLSSLVYNHRIYPGVKVAGLDLGGKNQKEAFNILEKRINYFKNQGIKIFYGEREWALRAEDIDLDFHLEKTVAQAFKLGREKNFLSRFTSQTVLLIGETDLAVEYSIKEDKLLEYLVNNFSFLEEAPVSSKLVLKNDRFYIIPEKEGREVNFNKLVADIKECLNTLQEKEIKVELKKKNPPLSRLGILGAYQEAQEMIKKPLKLKYEKKYWVIAPKKIISWIEFRLSDHYLPTSSPAPLKLLEGLLTLGDFTQADLVIEKTSSKILETDIKNEEIVSFLKSIASEIEQGPENARFKIEDGRVTLFKLGQEGKKINIEESAKLIKNTLKAATGTSEKEIEIKVETIVPDVSQQNINDLGIKTLIGSGESDFTGSPQNRKHNIRVGAGKLNGILIKPDEEFSVIQALGEVSEQTGFKPELVIKPDRTIPEFGGGLCQVSTTIFRSALYSGLPITERKPHKYVVSYYKPIGMDATIYIPHPDVRFKNDTPGHILIQTRIAGNKLYFDFYGTDDGRKVKIEGPYYTSEWASPGSPEYIETNTLKKGEKKQIEKEHKGVSTVFHRIVMRDGQEILKDSFYSKYKPWNAVFLVGPGGVPPQEEKKKEIAPTKKEALKQEVTKKEIKTEEPKEKEEEE